MRRLRAAIGLHEIKFDGYRAIAAVADGEARVFTRNGHDWSGRFCAAGSRADKLDCESALIDGEIVVDGQSRPYQFRRVAGCNRRRQEAACAIICSISCSSTARILRKRPLSERKQALKALLESVR